MIDYTNKNNSSLINIIADYVCIQMLDENTEGIYLFPYFDDCNIFEIVTFYKERTNTVLSSFKVTDSMITFYNFNIDEIGVFDDIALGIILYDKYKKLYDAMKEMNKVEPIIPSNYLRLPSEFIISINELIDEKMANIDKNNLSGSIEMLLTDYYYNILMTFSNDTLADNIRRNILYNNDKEMNQMHISALNQASSAYAKKLVKRVNS